MNLPVLAVRNIGRNKVRLALTVLGVAVGLLTFVLLRTAVVSWDEAKNAATPDRLVTRHKVTFVMPLPKRYVEDMKSLKGSDGQPLLRAITYQNWFGGKDPANDKDFFATISVDHETIFDVYDDILVTPEVLAAFKQKRNAAIVGDLLMQKKGWKPGDRVTLESPIFGPRVGGEPWTFEIVGAYTANSKAVDKLTFFFRWDYMNDGAAPDMQNYVGWIASRSTDPTHAVDAAAVVDRLFDDRDTQTLTQDERSFFQSFMGMVSSVLQIMGSLSYAILMILGLILANAIGMSVRERTNEYAAMKAIGFPGSKIAALILAESAMIGALGALVGVSVSYLIVGKLLGNFFEINLANFFPTFRPHASTYATAAGAALVIGLVAGILPAVNAARLNVVENLRRVA